MRKNLIFVLSCAVLLAAVSALADDTVQLSKDLSMTVGYKLWLNSWETSIPGDSGSHVNVITAGPVAASVPNLTFKYKNFLLTGSYVNTGTYRFPAFTDTYVYEGVVQNSFQDSYQASRTEDDVNLGYYLTPNLVATIGYKNLEQTYTETYDGVTYPSQKTHYNGATLGLNASANIGHGFSLYGTGVGGYMVASYTPSSTQDKAIYEATEAGIAWHYRRFGTSVGYKFQYISTYSQGLIAPDVTRGWMLGANYTF